MAINGTGSNDNLNGTSGDDTILAAGGNDTVHGAGGDDLVDGGTGADLVYGDDGADILYGGGDGTSDTLYGGFGDDILVGGPGADQLDGGDGNDAMGIDGGNSAYGGLGDDYLQINESSTGAFGHTLIDGGAGFDFVDFTYYQYAADVWIDQATANGFEVRNAEAVRLGAGGGTAYGSAADDTIVSGSGTDSIDGAGGDDVLMGGHGGNDTLNGGAGDDTFLHEGGNALMMGGVGRDTADFSLYIAGLQMRLVGLQQYAHGWVTLRSIEVLVGSEQDDTLQGGEGDDTIIGGGGANDWLRVSAGSDLLDGGDGDGDIVMAAGMIGAIAVDLAARTVTLEDGSVNRFVNAEVVWGGNGDDTFVASAGDDRIDGGDRGDDVVSYATAASGVRVDLSNDGGIQDTRGSGKDALSRFEILIGSAFNDVLTSGWYGPFTLRGGAGDDKLFVSDIMQAGEYDGGDGVDTLTFGDSTYRGFIVDLAARTAHIDVIGDLIHFTGIERVVGTSRDDRFLASAGDDVMDGAGGFDTVTYEKSAAAVKVSLSLGGGQKTGGSGVDRLVGIEQLIGSAHGDALTGAHQATVFGARGDDVMIGVGDGTLVGGGGDDTFLSGGGGDWIDGSDGNDTVSYASAGAAVTVRLALRGQAQNTLGAGFDTLDDVGNLFGSRYGDRLTGDDAANRLVGGAGADTLDGGLGADVLEGGAGRDKIIGGMGADLLRGGKENDVFAYRQTGESTRAGTDRILDFTRGDRIDLSQIDADPSTAGDQAFQLAPRFTGDAGQATLRYDADKDVTQLLADADGDGTGEMEIRIIGEVRHWDFVW